MRSREERRDHEYIRCLTRAYLLATEESAEEGAIELVWCRACDDLGIEGIRLNPRS